MDPRKLTRRQHPWLGLARGPLADEKGQSIGSISGHCYGWRLEHAHLHVVFDVLRCTLVADDYYIIDMMGLAEASKTHP